MLQLAVRWKTTVPSEEIGRRSLMPGQIPCLLVVVPVLGTDISLGDSRDGHMAYQSYLPSLGAGLLKPGEVGISATNRNFKGRMGSREADVYLGMNETKPLMILFLR